MQGFIIGNSENHYMSCKALQNCAYCETVQPERPVGVRTCYKHSFLLIRLIVVLIAEVAFCFEIKERPSASGRQASSIC